MKFAFLRLVLCSILAFVWRAASEDTARTGNQKDDRRSVPDEIDIPHDLPEALHRTEQRLPATNEKRYGTADSGRPVVTISTKDEEGGSTKESPVAIDPPLAATIMEVDVDGETRKSQVVMDTADKMRRANRIPPRPRRRRNLKSDSSPDKATKDYGYDDGSHKAVKSTKESSKEPKSIKSGTVDSSSKIPKSIKSADTSYSPNIPKSIKSAESSSSSTPNTPKSVKSDSND